jgi:hypothetical protein
VAGGAFGILGHGGDTLCWKYTQCFQGDLVGLMGTREPGPAQPCSGSSKLGETGRLSPLTPGLEASSSSVILARYIPCDGGGFLSVDHGTDVLLGAKMREMSRFALPNAPILLACNRTYCAISPLACSRSFARLQLYLLCYLSVG